MASIDLFPGQWQPQVVLMAALEVGLIEALLDDPCPAAQVTERLALDERAALRVIGVLVDAGYLEERGEGVVVSPDVRARLDPADAAYVGDRLLHMHALLGRWAQLPAMLREGGPASSERTPESLRAFIGAMRAGARERARPLAEHLAALYPATRSVLDIGGGPATQALAFRELGWEVTVLDFPEVVDLMADELARGASPSSGATRRKASLPAASTWSTAATSSTRFRPRNVRWSWRAPPAPLPPAAPWPSTTSCAARACPRRSSP